MTITNKEEEIYFMKRQVRRGVFETNSSSVHSLTMCMESDYDKWVAGEFVWSRYGNKLVPITDDIKASMEEDEREYLTYKQFNDCDYLEYEIFEQTYKTPNKETVKAFGYYGHG